MKLSLLLASLTTQTSSTHEDRAAASFASTADTTRLAAPAIDGVIVDRNQRTHIDDSYAAMRASLEKLKEAKEENNGWNLLGSIFMGPIIGTQIGRAIGSAANDDTQDAASESRTNPGATDLAASATDVTATTRKPTTRAIRAGNASYSDDKDP